MDCDDQSARSRTRRFVKYFRSFFPPGDVAIIRLDAIAELSDLTSTQEFPEFADMNI